MTSKIPLFSEQLRGGAGWSWRLRPGQRLRLTDLDGGANLPLLAYNAEAPVERYSMPDTLKGQHSAFLGGPGSGGATVAYSDMGRVLLSLAEDSVGWHDTITGYSHPDQVAARYGSRSYQQARNQFYRSAFELLLIELGKHGLGKRDLCASINCFSKVAADAQGSLAFVPQHAPAGASLTLRAEMPVLIICCAIQHPLDPATAYAPKRVQLELLSGEPAGPDDPCWTACEQNARAFELTRRYRGDPCPSPSGVSP